MGISLKVLVHSIFIFFAWASLFLVQYLKLGWDFLNIFLNFFLFILFNCLFS